ncbi:MAG: flavin reductase family protein [Nocardioidaceae bacterium]
MVQLQPDDESRSDTYLPPDSASFRRVLGRFATGVTVLATTGPDGVHATTANAFTAVSLDPPLILVCLQRESRLLEHLVESGRFSVNVLAHDQEHVAQAMAAPVRRPMDTEGVTWFLDRDRLPLLRGALAHVHCSVEEQIVGGDHQIVIGRVRALDGHEGSPLLFVDGQFRHAG